VGQSLWVALLPNAETAKIYAPRNQLLTIPFKGACPSSEPFPGVPREREFTFVTHHRHAIEI